MISFSSIRRSTTGAVINGAAFVIAYEMVIQVFAGSEARVAYGLLSGWWSALYWGYVFSVGLGSSIPYGMLVVLWSTMGIWFPRTIPLHDLPGALSDVPWVAGQLIVLTASPIFINSIVRLAWRSKHRHSGPASNAKRSPEHS